MSIGKTASREDGATAITLMIVLTVLLGFAAIAVDGAAAWALKRQDQSAADTGAVAGAIFTANRTKATAMLDAETEIIRITFATVSPDMTLLEWTTEWTNCTDSNKPARFVETLNSPCISFTSNLGEVRVQTPIIPSAASFGGIFGVSQLDTSAAAEVKLNLGASGGILPFGIPGGATGPAELCLKEPTSPMSIPPCDGPVDGNFSFLNFTQFGYEPFGTTKRCTGNTTNRLTRNIAQGVDHPLGTTEDFPVDVADEWDDRTACQDGNFNANPYQVKTEPGTPNKVLHEGLATGATAGVFAVPGRLELGTNHIEVRGNLLDDTPLWQFLNNTDTAICGFPVPTHDEMVTCLESYMPGDGVIFTLELGKSARFAWVPLFHDPTLGGGASTILTIKEFLPVYIQTTFWECDPGNPNVCDLIWDPDEAVAVDLLGPAKDQIEAMTALIIPLEALPQETRQSQPGSGGQIRYLLSK